MPSDELVPMDRSEAESLAEQVLGLSRADEAEVRIVATRTGNTRFAVNRITTSAETNDRTIEIAARIGMRTAAVSTNDFRPESLERSVREAERIAASMPDDPETMPALLPQSYAPSNGFHESTALVGDAARAAVAAGAIERSRSDGLVAAGFILTTNGASAVANSAGLFGYHASTSIDYTLTVRTSDGAGSGWASRGHRDWSAVDFDAASEEAGASAMRARDPRPLDAGRYDVIMMPEGVSNLVGLLAWALSARTADEGRSVFSRPGDGSAIGEQIIDPRLTLRSDPQRLGSAPFDSAGLGLRGTTWIEEGRLKELSYSRFWAARKGVAPTGTPASLRLLGGRGTVDDLIRSTERALLVTRLWYIRSVDARTLTYTGLTRDGVFVVEDGAIRYPVNNFRWNDSALQALGRVVSISEPVRVAADREVPALLIRDFNFTSVSKAV